MKLQKILILKIFLLLAIFISLGFFFRHNKFVKTEIKTASNKITDSTAAINQSEIVIGSGDIAEIGKQVSLHYDANYRDSKTSKEVFFDTTRKRGQPLQFRVGAAQTLPGIDLGVIGMKQGGRRKIIIPPHLGYGAQGAGAGLVPANATLIYELELVSVKD
jgi:FKBP-type peptidyl-prolyl cis-trans isomerase